MFTLSSDKDQTKKCCRFVEPIDAVLNFDSDVDVDFDANAGVKCEQSIRR